MNKEVDIDSQDTSIRDIIRRGISLPVWIEMALFWMDGMSKEEYGEILHEMRSLEANIQRGAEEGTNNSEQEH